MHPDQLECNKSHRRCILDFSSFHCLHHFQYLRSNQVDTTSTYVVQTNVNKSMREVQQQGGKKCPYQVQMGSTFAVSSLSAVNIIICYYLLFWILLFSWFQISKQLFGCIFNAENTLIATRIRSSSTSGIICHYWIAVCPWGWARLTAACLRHSFCTGLLQWWQLWAQGTSSDSPASCVPLVLEIEQDWPIHNGQPSKWQWLLHEDANEVEGCSNTPVSVLLLRKYTEFL